MRRSIVPSLVFFGCWCFLAGAWEVDFLLIAVGTATAAAGLAIGLLLHAREFGGCTRLWCWIAWAVSVMLCSAAFIALGADLHSRGAEGWVGLAAILLWCGMLLQRLAATWGSWRRVWLWVLVLVGSIPVLGPVEAWGAAVPFAGLLMCCAWSGSAFRVWDRELPGTPGMPAARAPRRQPLAQ